MTMRVLLVDDEEKFAMMLAKRLALRGIDVDYVHNGEDALRYAAAQQYDIAILDVKMPGLSGVELKRELIRKAPGVSVVFLTGHGSKEDFEKGTAEGSLYLSKPLQIEQLVKTLHELGSG
jgi:DNA-binding response OmpR family regulator